MRVEITPELCIAGRDVTEPRLDPAGRRLAFVTRAGGPGTIQLLELDDSRRLERQLTTFPPASPGRGMYGGCFAWMPDGSAVVYCGRDGGLWRQPVPGGPVEQLAPADADRPIAAPTVAPDGSFVVAVVATAEVWRYSIPAGRPRRLDDGGHDFCADPVVDPTGRFVSYQGWSVPDMPWDGASRVTVAAHGSSGPDGPGGECWRPVGCAVQQPQFAPDGTPVHVHDGSGWLQVWWGARPLLADGDETEHADASWGQGQASFAMSPDGRQVAVARNERGFGRLSVVDVDTGLSREVARGIHGQLSWRGHRLAALRTGARTPTQIVVYDTGTWERQVVAVGPAAGWDEVPLVEPSAITLDHDGTTLHARWYCSPAPTGRLLVMLHGGPTGQWPVTFMPRVASWLQRGWDVLLPDHRGSTGHGRAYQQALDGRWGELDVSDTAAWIDHAHRAGLTTPARTVVMGGSSGGYTVLRLLGSGRAAVAGGIALFPVTDLVDLAARSHRFEAHSTIRLIGPLEDVARYHDRSALAVVTEVTVPLLVLHGTADPVVPVEGTIAFVEALRARGGDVGLHLFDGEGHGFRQPEHQLAEYRLVGEFLDRVTGSQSATG